TVSLGFPFGEFDLGAAASHDGGQAGSAAFAAYRFLARPVNVGVSVVALSDHYATLSLSSRDDRPVLTTSAFVGAQVGARTDVTLSYVRSQFRDRGTEDRISGLCNIRLTDRASVLFSASHSTQTGARPTNEGFAGLSIALGERTTANVSYQRQGTQNQGAVEVQRSLPIGPGWGYRGQAATTGDTGEGLVMVQYQGPYGRYEASYQRADGHDNTVLSAAGGLVAIGGADRAPPAVTA